jgi:two-component system invasion response regulator UvrY
MRARTIVIVDDHDMLRLGLRDYLASLPGFEMVGEARTAREAFRIIEALRPDVVVMDIAMPGLDGIVATREILRRVPQIRVLIFSAHGHIHDVKDAVDAGALAYALKSDQPEELTRALESVSRGLPYLSPSLSVGLAEIASAPSSLDVLRPLSKREREIFRLAADCRTSPEIAHHLCLARKTVDTHLNRINRKLQLRDRAELVRLAASVGLVHSLRRRDPHPAHRNGVAPTCDNEPARVARVESTGIRERVAVTGAHRAKEVGWTPARGDDERRQSVER